MSSVFSDLLGSYEDGELGRSVREVRLAGLTLRQVNVTLTARGFVMRPEAIVAERTADGAPQWVRVDGSASATRSDPSLVPVECWVHRDRGMVRVFPIGDPRARLAPVRRPTAIKSALFIVDDPSSADTTFGNEAFRVTDAGQAVPKSLRAAYGFRADPSSPVASYELAIGVLSHVFLPLEIDAK